MKEYDDESEEDKKEENEELIKKENNKKEKEKEKEIQKSKEKEEKKINELKNEKVTKKENQKEKKLSEKLLEANLKEQQREEEEIRRNLLYNKEQLKYNEYYSDPQRMNKFLSQRHLYDHKREKKDPLINITNKNLQTEYISEATNLFIKLFLCIFLSILIFIQDCLILKNYKSFNEVILSQIFCAFTFFNSILLIVELYRDALRDQLRYILFRLFSIFLSILSICSFSTEFMNIYTIYNKIKVRKEICRKDKKRCGDNLVNNIILVFSCIIGILIIFLSYFIIYIGFKSFKIIFGCDMEVFQKQIIEDKKEMKDEKEKKEDIKKNKKEVLKNNKKEHLKNE